MDGQQRTDSDSGEDGAELSARPDPQRANQRLLGLVALLWLLGLAVVGVTGYASWQLWLAWQTAYEPYWQHLWIAIIVLFFLAVAYLMASLLGPVLLGLRSFIRQIRAQNDRVREAAAAGDDRLAPLAAEQPEPLPSSELPIGPETFGPFGPTRAKPMRSIIGQEIVTILVTSGMIAGFVVLANSFPDIVAGPFGGMGPLIVIFLGMCAIIGLMSLIALGFTIWTRLRYGKQESPLRVVADDWGVRGLGAGRHRERRPVAWHEIRAFYKADDLLRLNGNLVSEGPAQSTTYTVDAGERRIQWVVREKSSPAQRAESERLARLIVTHTRLPLRDLSALVSKQGLAAMDLALSSVSPLLGYRFEYQASIDISTLPSVPSAARRRTRRLGPRRSRWFIASQIIAIALALLLFVAGMLAQMIQSQQYWDLIYQQIDRETPYYTIDYREDDGKWLEHPATPTDGSYTFASDGYHMTGAPNGQPMEAVLADTYGDATVELTSGLAGTTPPSDYGVVLRESDDGTTKVVFSASSSGGWALADYQTDTTGVERRTVLMSNDHSDAVQTGQNANNFMTIIMRGGDYLCFVRGHPVGIYHDSSGQTPRQGHSGIWLGNSRAVGIYYYFSIHPPQ